MYEGHSMLGGVCRKPAVTVPEKLHSPGKKTTTNFPEQSQVQQKEINSCDEKDLETPHTHSHRRISDS